MDHSREVDLIQAIDHDVRQLLDRCSALANAGEARPLLALVGHELHDRLCGVAELSGSLAMLVSKDGDPLTPARRPGRPARGSAPVPALRGTDPQGQSAAQSPTAPVAPLVIRLKPRMPRGAWRRKGLRVVPESGDSTIACVEDAPEVAEEAVEQGGEPAREPVYRLRKAGATEPEPIVATPREGRDALDRLRDFFGSVSGNADAGAARTTVGYGLTAPRSSG